MGSCSNNSNVRYRGFAVVMQPHTFLQLVLPLSTNEQRTKSLQGLTRGALDPGWGPPTLYMDAVPGYPLQIVGHEGRHRCNVWSKLCDDTLLLVHVIPSGEMRARHVTDTLLQQLQSGVVSERSTFIFGPLFDFAFAQNRVFRG